MTGKSIVDASTLLDKARELESYDLLKLLLTHVLQAVLEAERDEVVGAQRYERSQDRADIRSGYKPRSVSTVVGDLKLRVPQTRYGYRSQVLEGYNRIDQALLTMATEMYANGVSTRKIEALLERTIGTSVSPGTISKANARLDQAIAALRSRPLGRMPVLMADARFNKVRRDGAIRSTALLVVVGIDENGYRRLLDFMAVQSETGPSWKVLFERLKERGVHGVEMMISDDHTGLRDALCATFVGAIWQRCQTHLMRNILDRTPKAARQEMKNHVKAVFQAEDIGTGEKELQTLAIWADGVRTGLGSHLEAVIPEGLSVLALPKTLRKRLRTTNMLERVNQEIKRRTNVARIFPNMDAFERLAGIILVHIDEAWQEAGRRYLNVELLDEALDNPTLEPLELQGAA